MERTLSRKRPWLAALLAAVVPAFGHLYLRRWLRALGWLVATVVTTMLFVPESTVNALTTGQSVAWMNTIPLLAVSALSVVDAYQLAVLNNYLHRARSRGTEGNPELCPSCSRPVDTDLDFCQWCATPLAESAEHDDAEPPQRP